MPIRINCPGCSSTYNIPDRLLGKKVLCKQCQHLLTVTPQSSSPQIQERRPLPSPTVSAKPQRRFRDDDDDDDDDFDERPRKKRRQKSEGSSVLPALLIGGGVGGGLLLVIAIILVVVFSTGPSDHDHGPLAQNGQNQPGNPFQNVNQQPEPQVPAGPTPNEISNQARERVKAATVYLRVTMPGGDVGEGSGFFAGQKGYVATNAHVLGMLSPDSRKPRAIQVVVNSGEPTEFALNGEVVGLDRDSDLAVVRVQGNDAQLPEPLAIDTATNLHELQKVYIFGFPLGASLGKNLTISPSAVSSIRKNANGQIEKIQVNGGMQPGNSGGPVVDSRGVVVGVSVAIIRGTQINFAVPGDYARAMFNGRHSETFCGEPYFDGNEVKNYVELRFLDPFRRISNVRVNVWAGQKGRGRPTTQHPPQVQPGDTNHQTYPLNYQNGIASASIPVPRLAAGQVYYFQPVLTDANGQNTWAEVSGFEPKSIAPLMVQAANLQFSTNVPVRTLKVSYNAKMTTLANKNESIMETKFQGYMLETYLNDPRSVKMNLVMGQTTFQKQFDTDIISPSPAAMQAFRSLTANYYLEQDGRFKLKEAVSFNTRTEVNKVAEMLYEVNLNTYESTLLPVPNRMVQPRETWQGRVPMILTKGGGKADVLDLNLTFTYEGVRQGSNGQQEGYIGVRGEVKGRNELANQVGGAVEGYVLFDISSGYVATANLEVRSDFSVGSIQGVFKQTIRLERQTGNPMQIQPPPPRQGNGGGNSGQQPPINGRIVLNVQGNLVTGRPDPQRPGYRANLHRVNLQAGRRYAIGMKKLGPGNLDPMVRVINIQGQRIAEDDDSGGNLNAMAIVIPRTSGQYAVIATHFGPQNFVGQYGLVVIELQ